MGKQYAPDLVIEHALINTVIPYSDVFRTYDVPAIMSIPMTMTKLADIFSQRHPQENGMGLIDCEDEAYIAAAGGFSMGIMRHPYVGRFINGVPDMSFPEIHRNLKSKMYEVLRAVHWHRIAPAFGVSEGTVTISEDKLCDSWRFEDKAEEIEEWWLQIPFFKECITEDTVKICAPGQISRNCIPATVYADEEGNIPFIIASKNPNGAFGVATLGRTLGREYKIPACRVEINTQRSDMIGVFGDYKELVIKTDLKDIRSVYMQDLADMAAYDVTDDIICKDDKLIISGELIHAIGTFAQPESDTSEPAIVLNINSAHRRD